MEQQYNMDQFDIGLDMSNPLGFGPPGTDIIDQFDFDQYLIEQADNPDSGFAYDPNFGLDTGEVGAE